MVGGWNRGFQGSCKGELMLGGEGKGERGKGEREPILE